MSLPGLGLDESDEEAPTGSVGTIRTDSHVIPKENEWRFEVALGKTIQFKVRRCTSTLDHSTNEDIQLIQGSAEIFGAEIVVNKIYTFASTKAAVYTWTGCTIEVTYETGALASEYVAEETTMNEYANTALALDALRQKAERARLSGPRVLILGPDNVGKTTLAKVLTSYAIQAGRAPVVVGLDPAESILSMPGTLTATVFKSSLEVECDAGGGWGTSPMSGPNGDVPVKIPLVYYLGSTDPAEKNGVIYKAQVTRLALSVQGKMNMSGQEDVKSSGVIIDTPGSLVTGQHAASGYDLIAHIVSEFSVNAIVCLGNERLFSDMVKKFDKQPSSNSGTSSMTADVFEKETISVIKLPRSGGVVERDSIYVRAIREAQIKAYFYGTPQVGANISLQPRQQQADFDSLPTIWRRISSNTDSYTSNSTATATKDETFLPGDADDSEYAPPPAIVSGTVPVPADQLFEKLSSPHPALRNCVLAVMNCGPDLDTMQEQEVLRDSSCMGFLYVTDIDEEKRKISLLSPVAGRVPNRVLVWAEGMEGVLGITA